MEYAKGLMDIHFTHLQRPFNEGWFMEVKIRMQSLLMGVVQIKYPDGSLKCEGVTIDPRDHI